MLKSHLYSTPIDRYSVSAWAGRIVQGCVAVQGFRSNSLFYLRSPVQINSLHCSNLLDRQRRLCFPNTSAPSSINHKNEAL